MSAGRRAAVGSPWSFMLTGLPLFAGIAGIAAPLYMQLLRLTLGLLSLSAGGHMRTRPGGGSVFQAGPNWPPVVLPSAVFWLEAAAMLVLVFIVRRRMTEPLDFPLQPFVLTFWCGLAAFYSWLYSLCFLEFAGWPRDSFAAALVLAAECLAFLALGVRRAIRSVIATRERKNRSRISAPNSSILIRQPEDVS